MAKKKAAATIVEGIGRPGGRLTIRISAELREALVKVADGSSLIDTARNLLAKGLGISPEAAKPKKGRPIDPASVRSQRGEYTHPTA